jgi:hypothetical protein
MEVKKQTKRVGLGILIAIVALVTLSGAAFAAFTFWNAQAVVEVQEGVTIQNAEGDYLDFNMSAQPPTVTAILKPGESQTCKLTVSNTATSGSLTVAGLATPVADYAGKVTATWDGPAVIAAGANTVFTLTLNAHGDAIPAAGYTFNVSFTRE